MTNIKETSVKLLHRGLFNAIIPSKPNTEYYLLNPACFLWTSPRPISTCQLNALPHLHLMPINLILSKGSYLLLGDISS